MKSMTMIHSDVAKAKLAHDLLHGFEVVLDDRVLEAAQALFHASRRTDRC